MIIVFMRGREAKPADSNVVQLSWEFTAKLLNNAKKLSARVCAAPERAHRMM